MLQGFSGGSGGKESTCSVGDLGSIPGLGRSPEQGKDPIVHGVSRSWTRLSDFTFTFHFHALEKEMATHSSVLAWRIPGMEDPGGLLYGVTQSWTQLK